LLQKERMTKAEKELLQKAWSLPDLLIAASQKVVVLLRRVFDQDALDPASLIEVVFEPIENAGDFDLLLVGQKAVQILPSEPGAVGAIDLRIELWWHVGKPLQRRTAPGCANQYCVHAVTEQRPQRAMLDIIERCFAAADIMPFCSKRIFEPHDALERIVGENPADSGRVVEID